MTIITTTIVALRVSLDLVYMWMKGVRNALFAEPPVPRSLNSKEDSLLKFERDQLRIIDYQDELNTIIEKLQVLEVHRCIICMTPLKLYTAEGQ
jgi:hypothetical protein